MTRIALLLGFLFAAALPGQAVDLEALQQALGRGKLQTALRKVLPELFPIVVSGASASDGIDPLKPLVEALPEECGRTGLSKLIARVASLDAGQKEAFILANRRLWQTARAIRNRRNKKADKLAALTEARNAASRSKDPWIQARLTLLELEAHWLELGEPPESEAVEKAITSCQDVEDRTALGSLLLESVRAQVSDLRPELAKATRMEAAACRKAMRVRENAAPERPWIALTDTELALLLLRLEEVDEAAALLKDAAKALKEDRPPLSLLPRAAAEECAIRKGKTKKAVQRLKKLAGPSSKIEDLPLRARVLLVIGRALRIAELPIDGAMLLKDGREGLQKANAGPAIWAPIAYQGALCWLAGGKIEPAVAELEGLCDPKRAGLPAHVAHRALHLSILTKLRAKRAKIQEGWKEQLARLATPAFGDRAVDALHKAPFEGFLASTLFMKGQTSDPYRMLKRVRAVGDEFGFVLNDLPGVAGLEGKDRKSLERVLVDFLWFHKPDRTSKRLAYDVLERNQLLALAAKTPEPKGPRDLLDGLARLNKAFRRLALSWEPDLKPLPVEEVRALLDERRKIVRECRRKHPEIALKYFPAPRPFKELTEMTDRRNAVVLYVQVNPDPKGGSIAYALSARYWKMCGIEPKAKFHENLEKVKACLSGKGTLAEYLVAAGELHKWIIAPQAIALEHRENVFVVADEALGGMNVGLLVPHGSKGKSWQNAPFSMREKTWAEIPSVTHLVRLDDAKGRNRWSTESKLVAFTKGKPESLLELGRFFDDKLDKKSIARHETVHLVSTKNPIKTLQGSDFASTFRSGGFLHLGRGACGGLDGTATLRHFRPEALVLEDPPGVEDPTSFALRTLANGTQLILMPQTGADPAVSRAIARRFWRGLHREQFTPGRALAQAQRDYLFGRLPVDGKKPKGDKSRHVKNWGRMRLILTRP